MYGKEVDFSVLKGLTLKEIRYERGCEDDDVLYFVTSAGTFRMFHDWDCVEWVGIEDVVGDLESLKDVHITDAREEVRDGSEEHPPSATWTFYLMQTPKGDLFIRWLGRSEGYYSESVSFEKMQMGPPSTSTPFTWPQ